LGGFCFSGINLNFARPPSGPPPKFFEMGRPSVLKEKKLKQKLGKENKTQKIFFFLVSSLWAPVVSPGFFFFGVGAANKKRKKKKETGP